jgi:hypothetical protein
MKTRIAGMAIEWENRRCRARLLVAGLLLASSACALGAGAAGETAGALTAESAVVLNVTNHYNGPMEIYAVGSGTSYRMGTVYPGLSGRYVVRPGMLGGGLVEFLAQSSNGGPQIRSGQLLLARGNIVDFEVATNPGSSTATIRP